MFLKGCPILYQPLLLLKKKKKTTPNPELKFNAYVLDKFQTIRMPAALAATLPLLENLSTVRGTVSAQTGCVWSRSLVSILYFVVFYISYNSAGQFEYCAPE